MTRKIIFTAFAEPSCFISSAVTPRGYKVGLVTPTQPTFSHTVSLYSSTSFPTAEKRKIEK
jgi:hypothetical protein